MKKQETSVKYQDLIAPKSEAQTSQEELQLKVVQSKAKLEVDIATTKLNLSKAQVALDAAKRAFPYDANKELQAQDEVEALTKGLAFAERILKERF